MSNLVFPTGLKGIQLIANRSPQWRTQVQEAMSGKETAIAKRAYPRIVWELSYEVLRDDLATSDLKIIVGFFNALNGGFDTFLYTDPYFNSVTAQNFGTGDGATRAFQLSATYKDATGQGWPEAVQNLNGTPAVYVTFGDYRGTALQYQGPRTNLALQSQTLDNATWTKFQTTVTANAATAPDGTATADKIVESTANNQHFISQSWGKAASPITYTGSLYLQPSGRSKAQVWVHDGSGNGYVAIFDLSAGTVTLSTLTGVGWTAGSAAITAAGGGAYRCSVTVTSASTTTLELRVNVCNVGTTQEIYTGDGTSGLYAWGAQMETAAAATTYIPTTTATVSVTDYALSSTGLVTFTTAPPAAAPIIWTGAFYYRCRFQDDELNLTEILSRFWQLKKLKFRSVKL